VGVQYITKMEGEQGKKRHVTKRQQASKPKPAEASIIKIYKELFLVLLPLLKYLIFSGSTPLTLLYVIKVNNV
jgi:hypothetical protein